MPTCLEDLGHQHPFATHLLLLALKLVGLAIECFMSFGIKAVSILLLARS